VPFSALTLASVVKAGSAMALSASPPRLPTATASSRRTPKDGYAADLNPAEAAAIEADMKSRVAAKGKSTDSMYSVTATSITVCVHVITNGSTGSLPAATTGKQISVPQQRVRDARG
jgi:hypothetical protein